MTGRERKTARLDVTRPKEHQLRNTFLTRTKEIVEVFGTHRMRIVTDVEDTEKIRDHWQDEKFVISSIYLQAPGGGAEFDPNSRG